MATQTPTDGEKTANAPPIISADPENATGIAADDVDVAIAIVGEHHHAIDPIVEARVVRKIDWFLVPAMTIGYGLVYYDKVSGMLQFWKEADIQRQFSGLQFFLA